MVATLLSIIKQVKNTDNDKLIIRTATGKCPTFRLNEMPFLKTQCCLWLPKLSNCAQSMQVVQY